MEKTILHLCCGPMASDSKPYSDNGYNVIRVDKNIGVENFNPPDDVYGVIANPPCTHFSFARTNAKAPRDLREGMRLVKECLRIIWECQYKIKSDTQKYSPLKFWVIENPNAMLKWFLGEPRLIYSPHEYGDTYQKYTALWGNFNIPSMNIIELSSDQKLQAKTNSQKLKKFDALESKNIHPEFYGKLTRQDRRSLCSEKFAVEFFNENK